MTEVLGYEWTDPATGEKRMLHPADVAVVHARSDNTWWAEPDESGWQPTLSAPDMNTCLGLDIWFPTKDACETFIRREVIPATLDAS